ncbi:PQQ-dependent dehydrogenase, methanol/ethanol family [Sphingosinicella microcystinivorans]|uniref:PQQ-dependent dehydrogenase, methanol/ethanol family n=1 Tax=Sphingosinicella microcystinivorans TaxID=335406 RepID=UPI0022F3F4C6|nr:PQQ-dependent dehydrogenase, methanol/ethanol family [Sphingosinicella microcystinivorans]WBX83354.1 PQQ-dependent dehydrogenase, methanol/ethanol family [Sphingosinicella microcystinivorans]
MRRWGVIAACLLAAACGGAGKKVPAPVDDARLAAAADEPVSWLTHGGTYEEQRYSRLDAINDGNVGKLGLAWSHTFDTNRGQEATPIVADGVLYTTSAWSKVYAFDAKTGALLWEHDPEVPGETGFKACCDVVNRGVALYDGKVYSGTLDGRLIALDAKTGALVWSEVTVDPSKPYTITGAPRIVKGRVLIGNGGAEYGVRGYVSAYDAKTGKLAWRFYTVPPGPGAPADGAVSDPMIETMRATWNGDWSKFGGGGTVWDAIVYDRDFNQVLIGVGNGSPWNHKVRSGGKGDNLFVSSVVALDADTGAYKWHYQGTPGETWDFTQTQPIILADLSLDGAPRKVMMQAPKNGYFYVIDRKDGTLVSAKGFVPQTWTTGIDMATGRPIEAENARFTRGTFVALPSALGAHNWHPMAFSPETGLVYLPAQEVPFAYLADAGFKGRDGGWNVAVDFLANAVPDDPAQFRALRAMLKGQLVAWDPVQQKEVWRVQYDGPWNGGVLATAGNLVFQGNAHGAFAAFAADSGKELWSFDAGTGVIAAPVSYAVNGEQYVAVMAGYGGAYPLSSSFVDNPRPMPNGRLLVFKLGGKAPYSIERIENPSATVVEAAWSAETVKQGAALYESTCGVCHGPAGISSGVLPDLRRSGVLADKNSWNAVVIGGTLKDRGMVSFAKWMSADDAEAIRAYVAGKANLLAAAEAKEH